MIRTGRDAAGRTTHERRVTAPDSTEETGPEVGGAGRRTRVSRTARLAGDAGMATAEYAIATVAAAGFAGLLILVLRSDEVREMLTSIVRGALSV